MDPATIAMLAQGVKKQASKLPNFGIGLYQFIKARQMEKRSKGLQGMEIPNEYNQNLSLAKRMAMEGMPEESYRNQAQAIDRNTAFGARRLQSYRNQAGNVANIVANANRSSGSLNAMDANARQQNQRGVMSARQLIAQAKQRAFDQEQQAIASLRGAGMQNIGRVADIGLTQQILDSGDGTEQTNPLLDFLNKNKSNNRRAKRASFMDTGMGSTNSQYQA